MKFLKRNLRTIYYRRFLKSVPILSPSGYETGEMAVTYGDVQSLSCNVSPATGSAQFRIFGEFEPYHKVIVTDDVTCPIDEGTVLYVDKDPYDEQGNLTAHDYVVTKVAKSINHISYAVRKVNAFS